MPYNLLLHRDAREALGIDLTNQIVVIDEAHSKCVAMQTPQILMSLHGSIRSYIVFARVIYCHAPTGYPQPLLGTTDRVHIKVQEQIGVKTCASPEALVPPSSHAEGPTLKSAAAKLAGGDDR